MIFLAVKLTCWWVPKKNH